MGLLRRRPLALPKEWGVLLLAGWLIATGTVALMDISSPAVTTALDGVAIAAGVLLLLNR